MRDLNLQRARSIQLRFPVCFGYILFNHDVHIALLPFLMTQPVLPLCAPLSGW